MRCLDDCHTYVVDTFLYPNSAEFRAEKFAELKKHGIEAEFDGIIHFYEMREDGTKIDGVTNEEVLRVLIHRLRFLNEQWRGGKFKCHENSLAITKLEEALMWLEKKTADRMTRGVEGTHEI